MAVRSSVKINTNQLNRALKTVEQRVERVAVESIEELMNQAVTEVSKQFKNAVYDGDTEDIEVYAEQLGPRTWRLVAEGEAVGFIEYGAGVGKDAGYINPTTGKPWWVFTANGRSIKLNAGGKELKKRYFWRTTRERDQRLVGDIPVMYLKRTKHGFQAPTKEEAQNMGRYVERDGKGYFIAKGTPIIDPKTRKLFYRGGTEIPVETRGEGIERGHFFITENVAPRSGAFISSGNPPNFIMRNASEKMTQELYKKFRAKFK